MEGNKTNKPKKISTKKKERADSKSNKIKVAKAVLKSPLDSQAKIAEKAGVSVWTVNAKLNELHKEQWFIDLINERDSRTRILSDDFKKEINEDLLVRYIEKCWSSLSAMNKLEEYIKMILWDRDISRKIGTPRRYEVLSRANFKCQACGARPIADNDVELHIDHILPASLWWTTDIDNLQVLCADCNLSKSNLYNINHNIDG